jgi:hypothetical protein
MLVSAYRVYKLRDAQKIVGPPAVIQCDCDARKLSQKPKRC